MHVCIHAFLYGKVAYFEKLNWYFNFNRKSLKTLSALVAAWANKKLGGWHDPDPRWHRQHFPDTSSLFNITLKHYLPNLSNFHTSSLFNITLKHFHFQTFSIFWRIFTFLQHSETLSSNLLKFPDKIVILWIEIINLSCEIILDMNNLPYFLTKWKSRFCRKFKIQNHKV